MHVYSMRIVPNYYRVHLSRRIGRPVSRLVVLALEPVARVALLALALLVHRVAHLLVFLEHLT